MASSSNEPSSAYSAGTVHKINRITVRMLGLATLYAATDFLLLAALSYAGALSTGIVAAFGSACAVTIGSFFLLIKTGLNRHFRDPGMATGQVFAGVMIQISFLIIAPHVGIIFLVNLFSTFMFGVVALDSRQFRRLWWAIAVAIAAAFYLVGDRIGFPNSSWLTRSLMCALFILTLGQTVYLAGVIGNLRLRLARNNQALTTALEAVEEMAARDALTDVLNRRALLELLEIELQSYRRRGKPFCVAMLDLDHFKQVNDRFGHGVGDEVLREFVGIVQSSLRPADRLASYGGDEFVLVLAETGEAVGAAALERVWGEVARYDWSRLAPGLRLTISVGIAEIESGESIEQLFERADAALYAAKSSGRNQIGASRRDKQLQALTD